MKSRVIRNKKGEDVALVFRNQVSGKDWVFLTFLNGTKTRAISFEELYYICRWIGECEDIKYPEHYHQGKKMVASFINDTILGFESYESLAKKYLLDKPASREKSQFELFPKVEPSTTPARGARW